VHRLLQTLFWLAVGTTLYFTLRPITVLVPGSDKTHHLLVFAVLSLLASGAFPRARLVQLGVAMSVFGALIEFLQPFFRRSGELLDWAADTAGIVAALLIVAAARGMLFRSRNPRR
jgi:VanZ family protein